MNCLPSWCFGASFGFFSLFGLSACTGIRRVEEVQLITKDVDNFWAAYALAVQDTEQAAAVFQKYYFARGTSGLQEYYQNRYQEQPLRFARSIMRHPRFYASAHRATMALAAQKLPILAALHRLQTLYPPVSFNNIYFLVGSFRGSMAQRAGLLTGIACLLAGSEIDTTELTMVERRRRAPVTALPAMITHELIHNTQQSADGTLLSYVIREGMADFIAELVTGAPGTNARLYPYGQAHEHELWEAFQREMLGKDAHNWLANSEQETTVKPCDLGYYFGYKICQGYYDQALNKQQALTVMLTSQDFKALLEQSGYAAKWHTP